jgi:hypothetical protein
VPRSSVFPPGRLYEAINAERIAVADKLGAKVPDLAAWFELTYGVREKTLPETCRKLTFNSDGPYQATGTPKYPIAIIPAFVRGHLGTSGRSLRAHIAKQLWIALRCRTRRWGNRA